MSATPGPSTLLSSLFVAVAMLDFTILTSSLSGQRAQPTRPAVVFEVPVDKLALPPNATLGCGTVAPSGGHTIIIDRDSLVLIELSGTGSVVGRRSLFGQGHGQIMSCVFAGWYDNALWVSDLRLSRLTLLAKSFQGGRSFLVPEGRFNNSYVRALIGGNEVLLEQSEPNRTSEKLASPQLYITKLPLSGSRRSDTLTSVELRHGRLVLRGEGVAYIGFQPWSDDPLIAIDPRGTLLVRLDRRVSGPSEKRYLVTVTVLDMGGTAISEWSLPYRPTSLSPRMVSSVIEAKVKDFAWHPQLRDSAWAVSWIREHVFIPRYQPEIADIFVGADSSIWLRHADRPTVPDDSALWTIHSLNGVHLLTLLLPRKFLPIGSEERIVTGAFVGPNRRLDAVVRYRF